MKMAEDKNCLLGGTDSVRSECLLAMKAVIEDALEPIGKKQDKLHQRMFIDNGKKSFQSSLSNMGVHIRLQWFFIGALVLGVIGGAIKVWMK